jgi:glutathione synthase/RimK-type ligase-like ATP-grasp enzyme
MHAIVIYSDNSKNLAVPFHETVDLEKYSLLNAICIEKGVRLYFAQNAESYVGNMTFNSGWVCSNGVLTAVPEEIRADVIYTIGKHFDLPAEKDALVVSHPELERIDDDKWLMYEVLQEYMAPTYKIDSSNWREVIKKITTDKVVLKPVNGVGGKGVFIVDKETLDLEDYALAEPYLAQNFVDSSHGIPGVVEGTHDLRLLFFNDELKLSFVRSAKPGNLVSNISQGGSVEILDVATLPQFLIDFGYNVDKKFSRYYPRLYTVDCMVEKGRPYISEINTSPFLPHPQFYGDDYTKKFYQYMVEMLVNVIEKSRLP